jgi:hypothetical protein
VGVSIFLEIDDRREDGILAKVEETKGKRIVSDSERAKKPDELFSAEPLRECRC